MQTIHLPLPVSGQAYATGYLHATSDEKSARGVRPCVVVCPGGGYSFVSDRENEPIAMMFFTAGYQVFVLTYSVGEAASDMRPLMELSHLMLALRAHAEEWQLVPDKIAVIGFSAGGHLAASLGTLWNDPQLLARMDTQGGLNRPDAMMLCYPVISAGPHAHAGSLDRVSGGDAALRSLFSLEERVTAQTPPAFLWHTADDGAVPVENTLLFCMALRQAGVPFEAHVFQSGVHGLSTCNEEVGTPNEACAPWMGLCLRWLGARFDFS